jgi:hypothetical protein
MKKTIINSAAIFILFSTFSYSQQNAQQQILNKMSSDSLKMSGIRDAKELPDFITKFKSVKVSSDTEGDVLSKLGDPSTKNSLFGKKVWNYTFLSLNPKEMNSVTCSIEYGADQKVTYASIVASNARGMEQIYSQGTSQINPNAGSSNAADNKNETTKANVQATSPASPTEGDIYFNSSDKHFYGWNGSEWKQLD